MRCIQAGAAPKEAPLYFPYLWLRGEECLAIRELVAAGMLRTLVVPIFKPVDMSSKTLKRLTTIAAGGGRFALITNSDSGAPAPSESEVTSHIKGILAPHQPQVFPAFEVRAATTAKEMAAFAARFPKRTLCIVHRDHTLPAPTITAALAHAKTFHVYLDGRTPAGLPKAVGGHQVALRDGFGYHAPNGNYPPATNFDDLVYQYRARGYDGFGDFATVGDRFFPGGGPAKHIALHLTENIAGPSVQCNHFVSKTPPITGNNPAKYFSALKLLCAHTRIPPIPSFATIGVSRFHDSQSSASFPGLGKPKRWSIMHHIERTQSILQAARAKPFI